MSISEIIDAFKRLDLYQYPTQQINELIQRIGKFGAVKVTLHPGSVLVRARPNLETEHFSTAKELSYKPAEKNHTFQRASTPNMTMYYAAWLPEKRDPSDPPDHRITPTFEALPWFRDNETKGYQRVTYSRWDVIKNIDLIAIVHNEDFYKENLYTRELVDHFKEFIEKHPDKKDDTLAIIGYLAAEFAKDVAVGSNHEYLISAMFSEFAISTGVHGVLYPSVRLGGRGFNVAITPSAADGHLQFIGASECSVYKNLKQSIIDGEFELMPDPNGEFLKASLSNYRVGEEYCLRNIGISSLGELKHYGRQ